MLLRPSVLKNCTDYRLLFSILPIHWEAVSCCCSSWALGAAYSLQPTHEQRRSGAANYYFRSYIIFDLKCCLLRRDRNSGPRFNGPSLLEDASVKRNETTTPCVEFSELRREQY